VSRRHVEISRIVSRESPDRSSGWQVCDLDSANGTFLNGQRLERQMLLQTGDRIMLGLDGPEFIFECSVQSSSSNIHLPSIPELQSHRSAIALPSDPLSVSSDVESVSLTQLFPIFSTGSDLTRKAYLLPGGITVAVVVSLFVAVGNSILFNLLLAAYLAGAAYYFIYQLCGKHKPWWVLVSAAVITILLLVSPVLNLFILVFRQILPGNIPPRDVSVSFPVLLITMFFGAGLMEELLKAVPVFLACWLGSRLNMPWRERLGVWEPLDGILLGSATAVGFTLVETLGQYVPEIYHASLGSGEGAAQLASLQLLIPRVLGSVSGHMAYSGYLGYFIGLSVLRPRKRWLVLGVGYLSASSLHTLWNAVGVLSPALLAVVGLVSYAFLAAAILKARELSPTRSQNFATRLSK
jgi:RsiW-degrading membrane proteinase PrsW (M82 family)